MGRPGSDLGSTSRRGVCGGLLWVPTYLP